MVLRNFFLWKRIVIISVLILHLAADSFGQIVYKSDVYRPKNAVSIGFAGEGSLFSFNYERILVNHKTVFLSGMIGVGFNQEVQNYTTGLYKDELDIYLVIPHHLTVCVGNRNCIDVGIGGSYLQGNSGANYYIYYPEIGYRSKRNDLNGISFRIFAQFKKPIYYGNYIFIPVGVNIMYSF